MTKPIQRSRLAALIFTMLLVASCRSGASPPARAVSNQPSTTPSLIGRWRQVSAADEEITMVITIDGKLVYSTRAGDKTQVMNLEYEVSGNQLITDQPSKPHREISGFSFEPSGVLVIDYNGEKTRFAREQ
jgi:hypothetical protein